MSGDLFHVGHLRAIKQCHKIGRVIVGLLTDTAVKPYKGKTIIPYEERKEILEALKEVWMVVPQNNLDPYENLIYYKPKYIVSGDGWEEKELDAAKRAGVKTKNISYYNPQSTTKIKRKIRNE